MTCVWHDNVLHIAGEFDLANADELRDAIDVGIASKLDEVRIDMALVEFCGSSCIAALTRVLQAGKRLKIVAAPSRVRRVLDIAGIDQHPHVTIDD